jgi:hypothetical protein
MSNYNFVEGNSNTVHQVSGQGNAYNAAPAASPAQPQARPDGGAPGHALHAFADMVGYSQLNVRLQKLGQDDLVSFLDHSLAEAGVAPGRVAVQDQGDARLLAFPADTDVAKVLAVMPRTFHNELRARNRDMAEHARMRVRLAFSMGASSRGGAGLVGAAPIAVARMANSDLFRYAMRQAPQAQCGLLIDDYLYRQWVKQGFRPDMSPDDYVPVHISDPAKGFAETGWLRLLGYSGPQVNLLLGY